MKIRTRLTLLVALSLLPVLGFSSVMTVVFWRQQRAAFEQRFLERVRAMSVALDRQLEGSISILEALASAPELDSGDLDGFRERADGWRRCTRAGPSLSSTSRGANSCPQPSGARDPAREFRAATPSSRSCERRRPPCRRSLKSPKSREWSTPLFVPVLREGIIRYVVYEDRQRASDAGFDAHLVKPVDTSHLLQLISDHGRRARLEGANDN